MSDSAPVLSNDDDLVLRALGVLFDRQQFMRLAGVQFDGKRDLYNIFGYDRIVTANQYRDEYARGGIAKRIVEAFPKATWRGGIDLFEDEDPEVVTPFEQAWRDLEQKHHIWNTLQNADILAGLSTYSAILIGAPGDLSTELPKNAKLLYLAPFFGGGGPGDQGRSASTRTQSSDTDVTIETFDTDPTSERFGEVLIYRLRRTDLSSPLLSREVHWTRVIHVAEGALDNLVYGVPTLENIWNLLFDLEKVTGGGSESYFQRAKHSMNLNIQKDVSFTPAQLDDLKTKYEEFQHGITNVLPTRGMDVKLIEGAVANFSNAVDSILKQIAGSKGIPLRILTGSEMGSLASEQDADNFEAQVQDRRTGYAGPMIVRKIVDRLIEYGYLPTPKQYDVEWPVKERMDEAQKADLALKMVQVNATYQGEVFSEEEVRERSFGLKPAADIKSSETLSELQKADVSMKLALTNKAMGITIYTDDEIRDIAYGFKPLKDSEKVPIGAPERVSVTAPPDIGEETGLPIKQEGPQPAPAKPKGGAPGDSGAPNAEMLAALEAAVEADDLMAVGKLLGLTT